MKTSFENTQPLRGDLPEFGPGDNVIVDYKVVEGDKERIQPFQGIVIGKRGRGINENFTVRKILHGTGVERIFAVQSPLIKNIRVVKRGKVKRSKIYYLRNARGKQIRIKEGRPISETGGKEPENGTIGKSA